MDCFQIGKEYVKAVYCHLAFNLYAEYIMWNARLDEVQAGINIAGRNFDNHKSTDDTTIMAESEEEEKNLLMTMKEESGKDGLKLNIQKTKIMASGPITSWEIDGETVETVADFIFLGSKITVDMIAAMKLKDTYSLEKEMTTHSSILAWRIPGTEEPSGLPSMGSHRVGHDWSS